MGVTPVRWQLTGTVLIACNCDFGCPCNFNALPTKGHCEGGWTWHVEKGSVNDIALDGLTFSVFAKWPGAIHPRQWRSRDLRRMSARTSAQRDAVAALVTGQFGGPWGILAWTWPTSHGPHGGSVRHHH
jgi:hypothetical protein